jgi:hypothetical protein
MRKSTATLTAIALAGGIYVGSALGNSSQHALLTPITPAPKVVTIDQQAVLSALSTKAQLVGLTGKIDKTVTYDNSAWYGDKTYELAATGTFKLGVNSADLVVTTQGNTVSVRFPQPKIISVDMPFDKAQISKTVDWTRKDITEGELQALYGKAREGAIDDIERNRQAFEKAEDGIELMIERLIAPIDGVTSVEVIAGD